VKPPLMQVIDVDSGEGPEAVGYGLTGLSGDASRELAVAGSRAASDGEGCVT
jgi:hypothetical protein